MNPYFVLFAFVALLAMPVSVRLDARVGQGIRGAVRVEVSGVPLVAKRRNPAPAGQSPPPPAVRERKRARGAQAAELALVLMRRGWLKSLLRQFTVQGLYIHARLSQPNAAETALCFAGARVVLEALARCGALPRAARGRVEADFTGTGSRVYLSVRIGARAARLCAAGFIVAAGALCLKAKQQQMEEEQYAATSH